jgi:hypothetical protein
VDNARKMIGKNVEISVTSVLQTTAGKMIFGKFDERGMYPPRSAESRSDFRKPVIPPPAAPTPVAVVPEATKPE